MEKEVNGLKLKYHPKMENGLIGLYLNHHPERIMTTAFYLENDLFRAEDEQRLRRD